MSVFADGKLIDMFDCAQTRPLAVNFTILPTTRVVAIETESKETPSIIGSFSDGVVTGSNWKCTSNTNLNWEFPQFDDSTWKQAVILSEKSDDGGTVTKQIIGPLPEAKWISTAGGNQNMYCRLDRDVSSIV